MFRILIVDDDTDILNFCKFALKSKPIEVIIEQNPSKARELIKIHRFDLIILDLFIPVVSGHKLLSEIKHQLSCKTPVIMFTAKRSPQDVQACV